MEHFRTQVQIPRSNIRIGYDVRTLAMGSCFTEHIGGLMDYFKFPIDINPFGIVYNPLSIHHQLRLLMSDKLLTVDDLIQHGGRYHSYLHHGHFSHSDPNKALKLMNQRLQQAREQLSKCSILVLTLGTAWAYSLKTNGQVVANCHKVPANEFTRELCTIDKIEDTLGGTLDKLQEQYPDIRIVFTVSPVRHLKDGAAGNQLSKATLIMAVHKMIAAGKGREYFPAYEIMMDDLRDYRFYKEDMTHPSELAVDYIWGQFSKTYIDRKAHPLMQQVADVQSAMAHRPIDPTSDAHKQFLKRNLVKLTQLKAAYPELDLEQEQRYFSGK